MRKSKQLSKMKSDRTGGKKAKSSTIGHLDEQTLGYYRRVSEMLKQDFENMEERVLFLDNVFKQLSQEVLKISQNQTGSGIVEELVSRADQRQLISVMRPFSLDWETACCDRFASYVTQSMVLQCSKYFECLDSENDEADSNSVPELFDSLYDFLCSSLALHMQHTYSSHVLRVVFEVLAGRPFSESIVRSRMSRHQQQARSSSKSAVNLKVPPAAYNEKLYDLCNQTVTLKKLEDHVSHGLSNPVLQAMLLSLQLLDSNKSASLVKKFKKNAKLFDKSTDDGIPEVVVSEIGSHLIEQYLVIIPAKQFNRIYKKYFSGHLIEMAKHPLANFVLQKFISVTHSKEQFQEIQDELASSFEQILARNHTGIIIRLAESCIRHSTRQKKFIKALQKAFHCYKPVERQLKLIPLLATLSTYEIFYKLPVDSAETPATDSKESSESVVKSFNLHGSLLTQSLLRFGNPRPIVDSIIALDKSELCSICCDASGSRVIEAFCSSETVGEASRSQLYACLKDLYFSLACDKLGSRSFDALWNSAGVDQRVQIAAELSKRADALRANKFGSFIHERCALRTFIARENEWRQIQSGQTRKRKLMKDIIDDNGGEQAAAITLTKKKSR